MTTQLVPAYEHLSELDRLFTEYTQMLIDNVPEMTIYLDMQGYHSEINHLEDKYGPPRGRAYILMIDGEAAGCIAIRRLDEQKCELKRLYIKPRFRGQKLAHLLLGKVIDEARNIGYRHILLDTLPFLSIAIHMYESYGFYRIASYNDSPIDDTIFLKYDL
jgi:GNAT superfamily N-acetyltransferase